MNPHMRRLLITHATMLAMRPADLGEDVLDRIHDGAPQPIMIQAMEPVIRRMTEEELIMRDLAPARRPRNTKVYGASVSGSERRRREREALKELNQ